MRFGMRKPSIKRSIKARTTGKVKRAVKKQSYLDTVKREWDGLRIRRGQHITRCTIRPHLVCGICLNKIA